MFKALLGSTLLAEFMASHNIFLSNIISFSFITKIQNSPRRDLLLANVIQFPVLSPLCQKQHTALSTIIFRVEGGEEAGGMGKSKWI